MSDALFDIYDNNTNKLLEDRYEIVDILADNLLPPPNEYNNLFHDMLKGFSVELDNLSPLFYIARITLNYAASSVAASVLVFFLIIYGISTEIMDKVQCIVIFF